nr:zinc finger protein 384-like isoform X2 [Rhipicephalus microplus]
MQRNAASCRDQSTSCEVGLSKSIQAELPTPSVSGGTQTNKLRGLQEFSSTPSVSLQNRVPSVSTNSTGAGHANVHGTTEGDCRIKMTADPSCNIKRENPSFGNVCFVVSAYGCGVCSRSFEEVDLLFSHVLVCPWPEPFQCGLCMEPCRSWGATRDHLAAHMKKGTENCPLCGHTFGKQWTILRHIQRHHMPVKPFVCNCCGGAFVGKVDIHQHSRLCRARTQEVERYLGSSEKGDSQARSHLATTVYKCSLCPSRFLDRLVIAKHMRAHLNKVQRSHNDDEAKAAALTEGKATAAQVCRQDPTPRMVTAAMDEKAAQRQAELRARKAAAARRRRQADPLWRARETAAARRRRQADPVRRAREAAAARRRRQANLEAARAREAAAARRRRQADPVQRAREAAAARRRRQGEPGSGKVT